MEKFLKVTLLNNEDCYINMQHILSIRKVGSFADKEEYVEITTLKEKPFEVKTPVIDDILNLFEQVYYR